MTAISENAKAFRNALEGLARENAAGARNAEQELDDQAKKAEKSAQEISEKNQKLVERIRERAEERKTADEKAGQEIQVGEDLDAEDPDPDVEHFSEQLYTARKARQEQEAAATSAQSAEQPVQHAGPSAAPQPPQQPADNGWNVQAGRFGRRDKQQTPPPAAPKPAAPSKPAPRRPQPAFDDDDDYENQTWLR